MDQNVWNSEPSRTLLAWAHREMSPWFFRPVDYELAKRKFDELNKTSDTIAVFTFRRGNVTVAEKPETAEFSSAVLTRANWYRDFFSAVIALLPAEFEIALCMNLADEHLTDQGVPIFCFQKQPGDPGPLLPDIDFITHDYYEDGEFSDSVLYNEKRAKAVFSGSTTGGAISLDVVRNASLPRLSAARYFVGSPRVDFRLPRIVQCVSADAHMLLAQEPFCQQPLMTWLEQLENKFIISLDGNGATCSRVVIALLSNSVLLKYESKNILFFFGGLQPWLHYIPIASDNHVEIIMDIETLHPERFEQIASNGAEFARTYLNRAAIYSYTAILLQLYAESFAVAQDVTLREVGSLALIAHIELTGDRPSGPDGWVGRRGSGLSIEGFMLLLSNALVAGISYQALMEDGELSAPCRPGHYCGTRGLQQPLFGLRISMSTELAASFDLVYEAYFIDGSYSGLLRPPVACRATSNSPLEAFRVTIQPKGLGID